MSGADLVVGEGDLGLNDELLAFNAADATGDDDQRGLTVRVTDDLVAELSGWTRGNYTGIGLVWVHEDRRCAGHADVHLAKAL